MKRKSLVIIGVLCGGLLVGGSFSGARKWQQNVSRVWNQHAGVMEQGKEQGGVYSNLTEKKEQEEIGTFLVKKGVSKSSVTTFLEWVNDYNERVDSKEELQDDFSALPVSMQADYSNIYLKSRYLKSGEMQIDPNCRLVSFLLFHDMVQSKHVLQEEDSYLMSDVYAIVTDPVYESLANELEQFITLFQPVKVTEGSSYEEQLQTVLADWSARKFTFRESDNLSLMTVLLHDKLDHKRYVGHTGIKFIAQEKVWFLEKYGSGQPYQCTKFNTDEELVHYLLSRTDTQKAGNAEKPMVFENNQLCSKRIQ